MTAPKLPPITDRAPICPLGLGNRNGYTKHGCRCRPCSVANSDYLNRYATSGPIGLEEPDWVVVERIVRGEMRYGAGSVAEREEAVRRLHAEGLNDCAIARRIHTWPETVRLARARLGLPPTPDGLLRRYGRAA